MRPSTQWQVTESFAQTDKDLDFEWQASKTSLGTSFSRGPVASVMTDFLVFECVIFAVLLRAESELVRNGGAKVASCLEGE